MKIFVDVDANIAVSGQGSKVAAPTLEVKSASVDLDLRFVSAGNIIDLTNPVISFGAVQASQPGSGLLVFCDVFNRMDDGNLPPADIWYRGQVDFYTANVQVALADARSLACLGEIRWVMPDTSIPHSLNFPVQIDQILIPETSPPPEVLVTYPSVGEIQLKSEKNQPNGYAGLNPSGLLSVSVIPPLSDDDSAYQTYANLDVTYPSLSPSGLISASVVPIDNDSIVVVGGELHSVAGPLGNVSVTTEPFTVPAVGADVTISCATNSLTPRAYYIIGTAGSYGLVSITDGFHAIFKNAASTLNAAPGTGIPFGQNISSSGPPGPSGAAGITVLVDAETTIGSSLIANPSGTLRRIAAGGRITVDTTSTSGAVTVTAQSPSDANPSTGQSVIYSGTSNQFNRLVAGSNVTLSSGPGQVIISATGGGSGPGGGSTVVGPTVYTTAAFTMPTTDSGTSVSVSVTDANPFILEQIVFVGGGGFYDWGTFLVNEWVNSTTIQILNVGQYYNQASGGETVPAGTPITLLGGPVWSTTDNDVPSLVLGGAGASLVTNSRQSTTPYVPAVKGLQSSDGSIFIKSNENDVDIRARPLSFNSFLEAPTAKTYTMCLSIPSSGALSLVSVKTVSGTCTAALDVNGSGVSGATAISVTSTLQNITIAKAVNPGDKLDLVVSSPSSPVDLACSVRMQPGGPESYVST